MTSKFLFFFGQFNLAFLNLEKRDKVVQRCRLVSINVMKIFKYGKNNDK